MSVPAPITIVIPFGNPALGPSDPGGIVLPIPVASQIGITNGAASFTDGFVPLNMTDPALGGILPAGQDFNGILYMLSSYCAWLQGGGSFYYDAAFSAQNSGYGAGAILRSAASGAAGYGRFWLCETPGNTNDPDIDPTGWTPFSILSGAINTRTDVIPAPGLQPNPSVAGLGFLKISNPSGATAQFDGFGVGWTGQTLTVTNLGPNNVTFNALAGASPAAERFRLPSNVTITTNMSYTFRYSGTEWVPA